MNLYLGAGKDKKEGFKTADRYPFPGIDYVFDATEKFPLEDSSVDYLFTQDFLEHLPSEKKVFVMNEIWRVLKPDGMMEHFVPNAGSQNDFGSPSHLSHWNYQQFEHFDVDSYRYTLDREYEGFIGGFRKVKAELVNPMDEMGRKVYQSIHVIYKAVK